MNHSLNDNPLLATDGLPPFDRIRPEHVEPAVRHMLAGLSGQFDDLERRAQPTWSGVMEPLQALHHPFEYAWQPVTHLLHVKNSPELRTAYEAVLDDVVAFELRVKQSEAVYRALKALRDGPEWATLSSAQQRAVTLRIRDAELGGVGLPPDQRARFNAIQQELSQLSTTFSNHVLDSTKAFAMTLTTREEIEGLPDSLLQIAAQAYNRVRASGAKGADGSESARETSSYTPAVFSANAALATPERGPWLITLDQPSFTPFMQHSRRRDLREQLYRAFIQRASTGELDNTPLIGRILTLRREEARLLGFASYAECSLARKMAPDVPSVQALLERLRSVSWDAAQRELRELEALAASSGRREPLAQWDVAFWAERLREQRFDYTEEDLRPYFPLPTVLEGLFELVRRLFGVIVTPADGEALVWHPDVRYFRIADERDGSPVASFYLDPYSRPENKRGGAWMDECLGRRVANGPAGDVARGAVRLPVAHMVCNGTPPVGGRPSLMSFYDVQTLFHEFGHALQHMLTTVDVEDVAGIGGVEWDAVECPSQFMENWCYHRPTLDRVARHVDTSEPLPDALFEKLKQSRTFRAASQMLRQLLFSIVDLELHHTFDPAGLESVFDVHRRVAETASVLPALPEDRFLCSFTHIFAGGYAAGYYSYKWAEVLSADAFEAFEEAGLDDERAVGALGRRFRQTVLSLGGATHPMEVFQQFRGRPPTPDALLRQAGLL